MRDKGCKARALNDPRQSRDDAGRFMRPPWAADVPEWQRAVIRGLLGAHGLPERVLRHDLMLDGWAGEDVDATLTELGVVRRRPFGEAFDYLTLPDTRPLRPTPSGPQFKRGRGGPAIDGFGNKRPADRGVVHAPRLGGRKV
jgi:hypothetical protein